MTKEQKNIAELLIKRMKEDNAGSISWVKFQEQNNYDRNDVFIAVDSLKEMNIIAYYPNQENSIRFVLPDGSKFTTFRMFYFKRILIVLFLKVLPIIISLLALVVAFYSLSKSSKLQSSRTQTIKQQTNLKNPISVPDSLKPAQK